MIPNQKHLFKLPEEIIYLNTAYMSPILKETERAGHQAISQKTRPYEIFPKDFFEPVERLKATFATLIGSDDPDRIAVIPSASYGIANVAHNLKSRPGQKIVVVEDQFPSNIYSWQGLDMPIHTVSAPPPGPDKGRTWNQDLLDAIDEKTLMVAIPQVHWSEGLIFDLVAVREKANRYGAMLVIDGTQSIGAYPFSVEEIKPDVVVCASYKWLLGPYSFGLAYYGERFDEGTPIENSWMNRLNSEDFAGLVNYQPLYKPKANRYCVGEASNFIMVPMLQKALDQILDWGVDQIQAYCAGLTGHMGDAVREKGYRIHDTSQRAAHLFGIELPGHIRPEELKQMAAKENIYVSIRGKYVRVAPHVFNTEEDIERLTEVLLHA